MLERCERSLFVLDRWGHLGFFVCVCVWKFDINATWRFLSKTFILKCFVHLVVLLDERCFEKALNSAVYFFLGGEGCVCVCVGGGT